MLKTICIPLMLLATGGMVCLSELLENSLNSLQPHPKHNLVMDSFKLKQQLQHLADAMSHHVSIIIQVKEGAYDTCY